MNIGTVNDVAKQQQVPQGVEKNAEHKDNAPTKQVETQAVETHLSQVSIKQRSIKILSQSMFSHMQKMDELRAQSLPKAQDEISHLRDLKDIDMQKEIKEAKPLFDFEEVAKNVLNFVGGALTGAARGGAQSEQLMEMLGQARTGVARGIEDARKILGGAIMPGDEIDQGIDKADGLINFGFDRFEEEILNPQRELPVFSYESAALEQRVAVETEHSGEFEIKTKDGDTVSISFASLKAFEEQYRQSQEQVSDEDGNYFYRQGEERNRASFALNEFAFNVEGDLDEGELKAIGDLMQNVSKLADEFFDGDVEAAYQQAMDLGFDDGEIASYALDLTARQTIAVQQAYQQVASYAERKDDEKMAMPESVKNPLKEYAANLLDMITRADEGLESEEDLQTTIKQVLGQQYQYSSSELFAALERFNHFNQMLLDGRKVEEVVQEETPQSNKPLVSTSDDA
ncbi:hypothetical protein C2869_12075 [Saccharobesus litoralis]|uniref:DUF5610 domain-containing protein n=1 Tax=Saccharobesus litoralis TaxID=2172099 RepID=A0A2S0VSD2_9ALTE|nr:DUF5610 domain-containing protein [Saccharobesus litoralis]AWB67125.1 hypothetical protein C2869_12075 [Saccharobesus litoralis]